STGLPGQATYPLPLADGRLVVFQHRRVETQAMVAVASDDGGRTFNRDTECVVYTHVAESALGADGTLSAFDYLMSMDRFTFGHPCGVVTGPNEALVFWYAGGPTRTSIRSARLRISSPTSIKLEMSPDAL